MSKPPSFKMENFSTLYRENNEAEYDVPDDDAPRWKRPKKKSLVLNEDTVVLIKASCTALFRHVGGAFKDRNDTIQMALRDLLRTFLGPDYETKLEK